LRIPLLIRVLPGCFYDTPLRSYPQQSEKESEIHKNCHAGVTKSTKTAGNEWGVQDKRLPDCLKPAWSCITTISFAKPRIDMNAVREGFWSRILHMASRLG
jgi:hypothetical protein